MIEPLDGIEVLRAIDDPPPVVLISAFDLDSELRRDIESKVFRIVSEASAAAS